MNNVEEFFSTQKLDEPAQVTGKKRKRQTIQPELDELKKRLGYTVPAPNNGELYQDITQNGWVSFVKNRNS